MKFSSKVQLSIALLLASNQAWSGNVLFSNNTLNPGQYIQSQQGKYKLIMQSDGSLVMYRTDGSVRYRMAKNGWIAVMQSDGNFVEYNGLMAPIWSSNTYGNPGSVLAIQDDGNLVIYSPTGVPVWNIGVDAGWGDPTKQGDVVGRDLLVPGASWVGHLGIWDGQRVIEAGPSDTGGNALHLTSITTFKNASRYWGVASANIAPGYTFPWCYDASCPTGYNKSTLDAREAAARAAYQAYLIGASYTMFTTYTMALPATTYEPARRGVYRCDTFVLASLWYSVDYLGAHPGYPNLTSDQNRWVIEYNDIDNIPVIPQNVFNQLKAAQ